MISHTSLTPTVVKQFITTSAGNIQPNRIFSYIKSYHINTIRPTLLWHNEMSSPVKIARLYSTLIPKYVESSSLFDKKELKPIRSEVEANEMVNSDSIKRLLPKARVPEVVTKINTLAGDNITPLFRRHLLIKAENSQTIHLPEELEFIRPVIEKAFEHEKQVQGDGFNSEHCFLTVRRSVLEYDAKDSEIKVQENVRDLWHYDGANPPENSRLDSIYSYANWQTEGFPKNFKSDTALSTQFYAGPLPPLPETAHLKEDMALYLQLAPKDPKHIITSNKGELIHWNGLHPHRSPFLANNQLFKEAGVEKGSITRTFIRMTFVDKNFIDSNNCHINMALFPDAYASIIPESNILPLSDRSALNKDIRSSLNDFKVIERNPVSSVINNGKLVFAVKLSNTLSISSQPLTQNQAQALLKENDLIAELQWTLKNTVKFEFSNTPIQYLKGQFTIDQFRKAWETGMTYTPVKEELMNLHRHKQLFASSVTLENIKTSFDDDIIKTPEGAERTRLFIEKNEFIALMHPSPLKQSVNLWRTPEHEQRRAQMKKDIEAAITDPVNPFAKMSELRSQAIVNSGKDLLSKSQSTNDLVDILGERQTLARYLKAVLNNECSFGELIKANQERLTHSIYGHTQLRVTQDLQTVLGVWVPLNFNQSVTVTGDDLVPFAEFDNQNLNTLKNYIAIEPPHNHHFDFSSKVVMGDFFQATYDIAPYKDNIESSTCLYDEYGKHWHLGMHQVGWAWPEHDDAGLVKNLRSNGTVSMTEGDIYYCYKSVIHAPVLSTQGKPAISLHSHAYEHGTTPYFYLPESMYKFHTNQQDSIAKGKTAINPIAIRGLFTGIQKILENPETENSSATGWLQTYNRFMQAPEFNLLVK